MQTALWVWKPVRSYGLGPLEGAYGKAPGAEAAEAEAVPCVAYGQDGPAARRVAHALVVCH